MLSFQLLDVMIVMMTLFHTYALYCYDVVNSCWSLPQAASATCRIITFLIGSTGGVDSQKQILFFIG